MYTHPHPDAHPSCINVHLDDSSPMNIYSYADGAVNNTKGPLGHGMTAFQITHGNYQL